jgi:hypothetical protein
LAPAVPRPVSTTGIGNSLSRKPAWNRGSALEIRPVCGYAQGYSVSGFWKIIILQWLMP